VEVIGAVTGCVLGCFNELKGISLQINLNYFSRGVGPMRKLSSVEELSLSCKNVFNDSPPVSFRHFDGKLPNLKELKLSSFKLFHPSATFEHLKVCELVDTVVSSTLVSLKLERISFRRVIFNLCKKGPFLYDCNLQSLIIVECLCVDSWVYDYLEYPQTKVEFLKIQKSLKQEFYVKKFEEILQQNRSKIQELVYIE
jgi:hypothetical protein